MNAHIGSFEKVNLRGKLYLVIRAIPEEKVSHFTNNKITTLKKKYFPVDLVVRKDGVLYVLEEIVEGELVPKRKKELVEKKQKKSDKLEKNKE